MPRLGKKPPSSREMLDPGQPTGAKKETGAKDGELLKKKNPFHLPPCPALACRRPGFESDANQTPKMPEPANPCEREENAL